MPKTPQIREGFSPAARHRSIFSTASAFFPSPFAQEGNLGQAVFARCLNLTTGYVWQLERGAEQPKGPALASLNVIRRKGVEAIL